jgi:hypothetical protein
MMTMAELPHESDTVPEMTFMNLILTLGATTVQEVIDRAYEEWDEGGGEGVTFSSPSDTITLTLFREEGVSFKFGGWGPYSLTIERVHELIAEQMPPSGSEALAS